MSANLDLPQASLAPERLVIRPQTPIVVVVSLTLLTVTAVTAAACYVTGGVVPSYIQLSIGRYRRCSFVRKDGRVAFTTPSMIYGFRQLLALARYLGVPRYVGATLFKG